MTGRFARDESGVAMGLAVVMVAVIGVMGAGLLTLVVTELHATIEANRGQRAFEMAETGVEVAKARLAEDPDLADWSSGELRMEGVEEGGVAVTIERRDDEGPYFVATSTGRYGSARRKIEATFSVVDGEPRLHVSQGSFLIEPGDYDRVRLAFHERFVWIQEQVPFSKQLGCTE